MTDAGWAEKKADSQTCPQCAEQYGMGDNGDIVHVPSVVRLLHKEHARSVRIVLRLMKQAEKEHRFNQYNAMAEVLTALQRGRTGRGK